MSYLSSVENGHARVPRVGDPELGTQQRDSRTGESLDCCSFVQLSSDSRFVWNIRIERFLREGRGKTFGRMKEQVQSFYNLTIPKKYLEPKTGYRGGRQINPPSSGKARNSYR